MTHWNATASDSLIVISVLSHVLTNGDLVVFMVDVVIHHPWLIVHKQLLGRPSLDCSLVPLPVPSCRQVYHHAAMWLQSTANKALLWGFKHPQLPQSSSGTVTHCWSSASISYRHDPLKTLTRDVSPSRGVSVGEVTCLLWDWRHLAVLPNNIIYVRPALHWSGLIPLKETPPYFLNPLLLDNRPVWRSRMSKWFRYVDGPSGWSNWTQRTSDPQLGRAFLKLPFKAASFWVKPELRLKSCW